MESVLKGIFVVPKELNSMILNQGKEVCSKEEEKKCETVEVNCRDVEFCDCDGEEEPYEVKPPECTQEEETVCIEVEPVCTTTKDEDCEPEYEEQCTKVSRKCGDRIEHQCTFPFCVAGACHQSTSKNLIGSST